MMHCPVRFLPGCILSPKTYRRRDRTGEQATEAQALDGLALAAISQWNLTRTEATTFSGSVVEPVHDVLHFLI